MAFAFVQKQFGSSTNSVNQTGFFLSNVTSGNLIFVSLATNSLSVTATITDTLGSTYSQAGSYLNGAVRLSCWYAIAPSTGSNRILATLSAATPSQIIVHEYSGVAVSSPIDDETGGTGTSVSAATGTVTVSGASGLVIAATAIPVGGYPITGTSSPFLQSSSFQIGTGPAMAVGHHLAATVSEGCTFTLNASANWAAQGVSFDPAVVVVPVTASNVIRSTPPGPPRLGTPWTKVIPPERHMMVASPVKMPPPPASPPIPPPVPPPPGIPPVPPPPPPVPPAPPPGTDLVDGAYNVSRASDLVQDLARHAWQVSSVLNSLFSTYQIVQIGPDRFILQPPDVGGLTGTYP